MRTKKALLNSGTSLLLQVVTVICGFILPRMILLRFGSTVNGAISSITQFLGYITMLEAGVGGVTKAALYKPMADNNYEKISAIANATSSFFRKLAAIFLGYAIVIACTYKYIAASELDWLFSFSLVLIISVSTFAQYVFGITNMIVLQADQKTYITNSINIITVILNAVLSAILLQLGANIHIVKLVSTAVYVLRPLFLHYYCSKSYRIDKKIPKDNAAIEQRWNGLGHHIAFFVYSNTDIMVITLFLGLKWVSVYSVYAMILFGIKHIINAMSGGSEAALGNMIAKGEQKLLKQNFSIIETLTSIITVSLFATTGILLIDFIRIYTQDITDINYIVQSFGILFVISEAINCIKQPYYNLIAAAGHYRQTRTGAFIEAGLNIVLSIIFVQFIGIQGVIIATILASFYRMLDYIFYLKKHVLQRNLNVFIWKQVTNVLTALAIILVCSLIPFKQVHNYFEWAWKAVQVLLISVGITGCFNLAVNNQDVKRLYSKLFRVFNKKCS